MDRLPRRPGSRPPSNLLGLLAATFAGGLLGCPDDPEPSTSSSSSPSTASAAAASGPTSAGTTEPRDPTKPAPPNVVLLVVDTLRADHLSHYGYTRPTAAPLDAFRDQSTLYRRTYSTAPWTGPSTMSIMTGISAVRHGRHEHGDTLPDEAKTLAEILSDAGYATHGISFNHVVSEDTGFAQGFDELDDFLGAAIAYPDISMMVRRVDRWIEARPSEPFFLYLQPMNVHGPYRVPRSRRSTLLGHPPSDAFRYWGSDLMKPLMFHGEVALREKVTPEMVSSLVDQYDVAVRYSMEEIAKILAKLESAGLYENTLVVLAADHGDELFDHGGFSHGYTLHREVLHVPLYVHLPGQKTAATVDHVTSTLDILPTILGAVGLEIPAGLDGFDLNAADPAVHEGRLLIQQVGWKKRAEGHSLIRGTDHLIEMKRSYDSEEASRELFDLEQDPGEERDLARSRSKDAGELGQSLTSEAGRLVEASTWPPTRNVIDQMDEERLRALGYVE